MQRECNNILTELSNSLPRLRVTLMVGKSSSVKPGPTDRCAFGFRLGFFMSPIPSTITMILLVAPYEMAMSLSLWAARMRSAFSALAMSTAACTERYSQSSLLARINISSWPSSDITWISGAALTAGSSWMYPKAREVSKTSFSFPVRDTQPPASRIRSNSTAFPESCFLVRTWWDLSVRVSTAIASPTFAT